jgi:hypothetical protein
MVDEVVAFTDIIARSRLLVFEKRGDPPKQLIPRLAIKALFDDRIGYLYGSVPSKALADRRPDSGGPGERP